MLQWAILTNPANVDLVYVVFRGTDSATDVLVDLGSTSRNVGDDCDIGVHSGIWDALHPRGNESDHPHTVITQWLAEHRGGDGIHVAVCGHSLGGACASLTALELLRNGSKMNTKQVSVTTFGSPQVLAKPITSRHLCVWSRLAEISTHYVRG